MKSSRFTFIYVCAAAMLSVARCFAAESSGAAIADFDWTSGAVTVTNLAAEVEFYRLDCAWRLTIDDDVWSEGSFDLPALSPAGRRTLSARVPFRPLPPEFAPVGWGRKRLRLVLSERGRELDARVFDRPGRIQRYPETPERFRFAGDVSSKPYLQNAGTSGVTVCLETRRELADLRLEWTDGRTTNRTPFVFRRAAFSGTCLAKARIDGLGPGTRVDYAVAGERGTFTTWTEGDGDFTCAIFGDFQSGLHNGPVYWDWEEDPFLCGERMFEDMVASGCDFAVTTGDLSDTGDYPKEIRPLLIERTCGVLGSKMPFFTAFGNHDTDHPANRFFLENPAEGSFAFFRNDCLFVCIDDREVGDDKHPGKASLRVWFERLMSTDAARRAKFRFVFQHVPVYVEAFGNCNRWLADLFEKHAVDCVFSGDHHGYERIFRGATRQVVNGCMGYFDHTSGEGPCLVNWYGDETLAGGHCGLPRPRTWRFQAPGKPGALGPETPIAEGLVPGYATLAVKGDTATWTLIGFNADGSRIGPIDSFTMKAGERPNAPKGLSLERYCYRVSPAGRFLLKYTLTGKGGRVVELCENDTWFKSSPILESDVVGVAFTNGEGKKRIFRLFPNNELNEK